MKCPLAGAEVEEGGRGVRMSEDLTSAGEEGEETSFQNFKLATLYAESLHPACVATPKTLSFDASLCSTVSPARVSSLVSSSRPLIHTCRQPASTLTQNSLMNALCHILPHATTATTHHRCAPRTCCATQQAPRGFFEAFFQLLSRPRNVIKRLSARF